MNITGPADHFTRGTSMGWFERVRRWLRERPAKSTAPAAPAYRRTARDDEDEEVAELLAIDLI